VISEKPALSKHQARRMAERSVLGERHVRRNSARESRRCDGMGPMDHISPMSPSRVPFVLALMRTPFRRAYVSRGALTSHQSLLTSP
jgi:hypothetical protein